ncbi:MAG TPA: hypothetical protein VKY19_29665 [Ktedonosporobacter sp.]|nr:hypothetical protein [Ktedonosporobacter sp.]
MKQHVSKYQEIGQSPSDTAVRDKPRHSDAIEYTALDQRRLPAFKQWRNFVLALLYLSPALLIFAVFSYYPLIQAIWLSPHITDEVGNAVRFIGLRYYANIFNLGGSGGTTYLQSL